uniref:Uncharacterized protein n=1 Tax=Oryza punctata TaxID=4537 RepID=A0A0E0KF79_ORYPU
MAQSLQRAIVGKHGWLVFVQENRVQFEIEDLVRASAEVLGSGNPPSLPGHRRRDGLVHAALHPNSPRFFFSSLVAASVSISFLHRRITITVNISNNSTFTKWSGTTSARVTPSCSSIEHFRPILILILPIYGANWGSIPVSVDDKDVAPDTAAKHANAAATRDEPEEAKKWEEDFDAFTSTKAQDPARRRRPALRGRKNMEI